MRFTNIGRGVYSLADAERLTGVSRQRISRWMRGYTYLYRGHPQVVPPLIGRESDLGAIPVLNFADLIEIRFLNAFQAHGVSPKVLRIASQRAKELLGRHHPFSTQIFKTDGRSILAEIVRETGDKDLLDVVKDQFVFETFVSPYLYTGLEYNQLKEPERWWPLGMGRSVVIDPARSFGAPILARSGIPTKILTRAVKAEDSIDLVARWFEVDVQEVKDAIEFESKLAA